MVELIKRSEKNIFAVTDSKGRFAGIIELNDIKQLLFNQRSLIKRLSGNWLKNHPQF